MGELASQLQRALGADRIDGLLQLSGGASRETWSFDADGRALVLRRDPPGRPGVPGSMGLEARAIRAASAAGLRAPGVVLDTDDPAVWGSAGIVMERLEGETLGRRILRDDRFAHARTVLTAQLGEFLAGLHAIPTSAVDGLGTEDILPVFRQRLASFAEASPTFELALRWLDANRPAATPDAVVHGDLRLGNIIVGEDGLVAVLDWELVKHGDPIEDLGWVCARAWRFGSPLPCAGVGTREELVAAYEAAGGRPVDPEALRWWEVLATLRWGLGCMGQARVHLDGMVRSVELAAIGRRTAEQEWDLLELVAPAAVAAASAPALSGEAPDDLHGRPTVDELLDAVRGYLTEDVMPGTSGRLSFHARVAANVVAIVQRELALGRSTERRTAELAPLGVSSEAELAAAIRSGSLDDRLDEVHAVLAAGVAEKLAADSPKHR